MSTDLSGSVVVITGASAGVGRATARAFAAAGADVGLLSREGEGLDSVRAEVEQSGRRALAVPTDVADPEAVEAAADRVESDLGEIDIWVNDAMATMFARVWDIEPAEIRRATEVTFLGAAYGTMAALKRMRPRNRGKIIQVGSALAYRAIPLQSCYCSSKFALRGFTDSLRCELMNEGSSVGVTMVHLPGLNTPQFTWVRVRGLDRTPRPVPPVFQPEVAAKGVLLAARTNRREVWVGGSTVGTIIGNRIAPKAADLYLAATNVEAQQTDHPVGDDRRDYLFSPLPEDRGAHGPFDDEASGSSLQLLATTHRLAVGAAAVALIAAGTTAVLRKAF
jgi:NAD(P)-dependent dehydrogenase (short-subunit alcohol dehydrogenase family)